MQTSITPGSFQLSALTRVKVAVLLAVLTLFFGIALFSPLHKHTLGKSTSCSFNNLEHQLISLAEAAVVIAPIAIALDAAAPPTVPDPVLVTITLSRDRAPPAQS